MDCTNNNIWGTDIICGEQGKCVMNEQGLGVCVCAEGYTHDMLSVRQRDCSTPISTQPFLVYNVVVILYCSFIALACLFFSIRAISMAKILLRVVFATMFFSAISNICHILVGNKAHPLPFFFFAVMLSFGFVQAYMLLYSEMIPLYRISRIDPAAAIRRGAICFGLFRVINFAIVASSIPYADYNNIANDRMWNNHAMASLICVGIEVGIMNLFIYTEGRSFIQQIDSIVVNGESAVNKSKGLKKYVEKLQRVMKMVLYLTPIAVPQMLFVPVVYFATGYFPYHWVIYIIIMVTFFVGAIEYVRYSSRAKASVTDSDATKEQSGKVVAISIKNDDSVKTDPNIPTN